MNSDNFGVISQKSCFTYKLSGMLSFKGKPLVQINIIHRVCPFFGAAQTWLQRNLLPYGTADLLFQGKTEPNEHTESHS